MRTCCAFRRYTTNGYLCSKQIHFLTLQSSGTAQKRVVPQFERYGVVAAPRSFL